MWWVVWDLVAEKRSPIDAFEVWMALDLFNAIEADTLSRVLRQQPLDQVFGFDVQAWFSEDNFLTFLDVVVSFEVGSAFERCRTAEELVQDDTEGPVVACVAQVSVAESLRGQVLLSANERV